MSDKALEACVKYERARQEIRNLTHAIGGASEAKCTDYRGNHFLGAECIERFWEHNKAQKAHIESLADIDLYGDEAGEAVPAPEGENPTLCPRCYIIDSLIQKRKEARKQFGIAKRRVSAIGRARIA